MKNLFANNQSGNTNSDKSKSQNYHQQYFNTDHLKTDLKRRSVQGGTVTMVAQMIKFCLSLGSNVLLARMLTPQDYGLVGMVTAVTGFVTLFKDLGLSTATIQKEEINHEQVSTLFWVNVALSMMCAIAIIAISPLISSFYREPRLLMMTIVSAIGLLISGLGVQHAALLNRQMRYQALMGNDILSGLMGILVAIVTAWLGWGYWSLVIMPLVTGVFATIGVWLMCNWRPGFPSVKGEVGSMLAFGGHLTGFSIVNYFARNFDNVLIGRQWGAQQLGQYAKAYQLLLLPLNQINAPITGVAIPTLSRLQHEPEQFRHYYLKALAVIAFLTMPLIAFMIVASEEIISTVLGSQWGEAVVLFRLLSISALFQPICNTTGWLYISTGRGDRMAKWGVASSVFIVTSFLIGLPYQAYGVALAYAIAMLLQTIPCIYFATRGTSVTVLNTVESVQKPFLSCLITGVIVFVIKSFIPWQLSSWLTLIMYLFLMGSIYLFMMFFVFKTKHFYLSFLGNLRK